MIIFGLFWSDFHCGFLKVPNLFVGMVPPVPSYHQLQWKHASFKKFLFVYMYFSHNMCFTDFLGNAFDREDCVEHRWFFWCMFHTCLKRQFPRKAGKGKAFKLFISQILMRWATSKHVGWAVDTGTRKLCRTLLVIHVFCPWQLSRLSYQSMRLDRKVRKSWNLLRGQIAVSMVLGTSFRKLRIWELKIQFKIVQVILMIYPILLSKIVQVILMIYPILLYSTHLAHG